MSCRLSNAATVIFMLVNILIALPVFGQNANENQYNLFYACEYSQISASGGGMDWDLDEDRVTSMSSRLSFAFKVHGYNMGLETFSSRSLLPLTPGSGQDKVISMDGFAGLFGISESKFPPIQIEWREFYAEGYVDDTSHPVTEGGSVLALGDTFEVGFIYEKYVAWMNVGKWHRQEDVAESIIMRDFPDGMALFMFAGIGRVVFTGGKEVENAFGTVIEEKVGEEQSTGYGPIAGGFARYGSIDLSSGRSISQLYAHANGEVLATKLGGVIKAGYELGWDFKPNENFSLQIYYAGYFWPVTFFGNSEFQEVNTSFGTTTGVLVKFLW